MIKRFVHLISQIPYVRAVLQDRADLSGFRKKPTRRMVAGLITIGVSYTIGWPLIALLGILSIQWKEPLLVVVGGPVAYGLSHLVFILGAWLAGAEHAHRLFRWAVRVGAEFFMARFSIPLPHQEDRAPHDGKSTCPPSSLEK